MVAATAVEIQNWPQTVADFDRLVEATQDELVHFAFYRLGNEADAEDAVQDVYVRAFQQRGRLRHITEVRAYLFRMVRNRCTDKLRRQRHGLAEAAFEPTAAEDTLGSITAREEARELNRILDQIPEREAEVLRLRAWAELTFPEVAVAVGASVPTVKSRFRYGVEKLRRLLCAKGGTRA